MFNDNYVKLNDFVNNKERNKFFDKFITFFSFNDERKTDLSKGIEENCGYYCNNVSVNSSLNYSTHSPRILKGVISMFQGSSLFQSSAV